MAMVQARAVEEVKFASFVNGWRSIRPGKVAWNEVKVATCSPLAKFLPLFFFLRGSCLLELLSRLACKATLANMMIANFPLSVLDLIESGQWSGGSLIELENPHARPSAKELSQFHCLLKPIVQFSPSSVTCKVWCFNIFDFYF